MKKAKKTTSASRREPEEKPFLYRGIKIPPALGRRSPLAEEIRAGFRALAAANGPQELDQAERV